MFNTVEDSSYMVQNHLCYLVVHTVWSIGRNLQESISINSNKKPWDDTKQWRYGNMDIVIQYIQYNTY